MPSGHPAREERLVEGHAVRVAFGLVLRNQVVHLREDIPAVREQHAVVVHDIRDEDIVGGSGPGGEGEPDPEIPVRKL